MKLRAISQSGFRNLDEHFGLGDEESISYFGDDESDEKLLFVPATIEFKSAINVIYEIAADG